VWVPS